MKRAAENKDDIEFMLFHCNETTVGNCITYLNDSCIILHAYFVHIILPLSLKLQVFNEIFQLIFFSDFHWFTKTENRILKIAFLLHFSLGSHWVNLKFGLTLLTWVFGQPCETENLWLIFYGAMQKSNCGNNEDGELSLLPHLALKVRGPQFSPPTTTQLEPYFCLPRNGIMALNHA